MADLRLLGPVPEPIAEDERTVVCPFIDVIAYDTFEYRAQDEGQWPFPGFDSGFENETAFVRSPRL